MTTLDQAQATVRAVGTYVDASEIRAQLACARITGDYAMIETCRLALEGRCKRARLDAEAICNAYRRANTEAM